MADKIIVVEKHFASAWGRILGLLPDQTDLQAALDAKASGTHATTHVTGGSDVIASAVPGGNAGLMTGADKTKLDGIAAGAEVNVNADWNAGSGDAQILNKPSTFTPSAHATNHKSGGGDPIKLDELAAPSDVTTLNASTTAHGLLSKLPGGTANFLREDGTWSAPTATIAAPFIGDQAPGSFTIATDKFGIQGKRLKLTTTQRGTLQGTGRLIICG